MRARRLRRLGQLPPVAAATATDITTTELPITANDTEIPIAVPPSTTTCTVADIAVGATHPQPKPAFYDAQKMKLCNNSEHTYECDDDDDEDSMLDGTQHKQKQQKMDNNRDEDGEDAVVANQATSAASSSSEPHTTAVGGATFAELAALAQATGLTAVEADDAVEVEANPVCGTVSNNNAAASTQTTEMISDEASTETAVINNVSRCSRLLREFDTATTTAQQQRLATTANANASNNNNTNITNNNAEAIITAMETDEAAENASIAGDGDKMDIEVAATPPVAAVGRQPPTAGEIDSEAQRSISRILNAFWSDLCEGGCAVPEAAIALKDKPDEAQPDYADLVSNVLMEMFMQYFEGKLIDLKTTSTSSFASLTTTTDVVTTTPTLTVSSIVDSSGPSGTTARTSACSSMMNMMPFNSAKLASLKYVIACHDRCNVEQSMYSETRRRKDFGDHLLPLFAQIKEQLIDYSVLILTDNIRLPTAMDSDNKSQFVETRSPLVELLYDHLVPSDYLQSLVATTQRSGRLQAVFGRVVNTLFMDMRSRIVASQLNVQPIVMLNELFNVVLPAGQWDMDASAASSSSPPAAASAAATPTSTTMRPICQLVGKLYNFYPTLVTELPGVEIAVSSFLGPFLSLSVFAEENPRFMDGELSRRETTADVAPDVQQQLENMRCLLHAMFHNMLKDVESRNSVLMYFSAVLRNNEKRTQLHADERTLARDGFMCNVMCVLQKLSVKIKLERVDAMYPFHWQAMINIAKETKLRFDEPQYKEWSESLRMYRFFVRLNFDE